MSGRDSQALLSRRGSAAQPPPGGARLRRGHVSERVLLCSPRVPVLPLDSRLLPLPLVAKLETLPGTSILSPLPGRLMLRPQRPCSLYFQPALGQAGGILARKTVPETLCVSY